MSLPYFPLYVKDYLTKTAHLTALEDGIYLRLLMHLWQQPKCQTANDLPRLMRLMRLRTDEEREALEMVVCEFFNVKDSVLYSKRLSLEFQKANELSKTRSRASRESSLRKTPMS